MARRLEGGRRLRRVHVAQRSVLGHGDLTGQVRIVADPSAGAHAAGNRLNLGEEGAREKDATAAPAPPGRQADGPVLQRVEGGGQAVDRGVGSRRWKPAACRPAGSPRHRPRPAARPGRGAASRTKPRSEEAHGFGRMVTVERPKSARTSTVGRIPEQVSGRLVSGKVAKREIGTGVQSLTSETIILLALTLGHYPNAQKALRINRSQRD